MARFKTIDDVEVAGKRVLLRVDFNVPMQDGRVSDATRIERCLPTIRDLTALGARALLSAWQGREEAAWWAGAAPRSRRASTPPSWACRWLAGTGRNSSR